jgi:hypothetical protein
MKLSTHDLRLLCTSNALGEVEAVSAQKGAIRRWREEWWYTDLGNSL